MSKKRFGDRKDAKLVRKVDSMHFIMGVIYPNRADNEAFISETLDLTSVNRYLEEKNQNHPEYAYNLFQVLVTALLKCITLRPKLNRFYANRNLYERNEITTSFVIKKQFEDHSEEGMAFLHAKPEWTIENVHEEIYRQVTDCRKGKASSTDESMDIFNKLPRFLSKTAIRFVCFLDRHGWVPSSFISTDPFYSSVVFSNLGSIKLKSGYHHLTNWGTTSLFCTIGFKKPRPFYESDGTVQMRDSVDIGLTVDERIADGYYYSKTIRLLKKLIEHPELLDQPMSLEVDY